METFREGNYFMFHYPSKLENNHIKETEHGLFKCSKFGSLINFQCHYKQLNEKSLTIFNFRGRGQKKEEMLRGLGEAIILNISIKGRQLFKGGD